MKVKRHHTLIGLIVLVLAVLIALALILTPNDTVTGRVIGESSLLSVESADGSSLGQPLTTESILPAPNSQSLQPLPASNDLHAQPPSSELQQPGTP
jgi:hypothetical protein